MVRRVAVALVASVLVAVTGCGGGSSTPQQLTVSQFHTRMSAICRSFTTELARAARTTPRIKGVSGHAAQAPLYEKGVALRIRLERSLARIEAPDRYAIDFDRMQAAGVEVRKAMAQLVNAFRAGGSEPKAVIARAQQGADRWIGLAQEMDLPSCQF
jgi:hypothetical protein